MMVFTCRSMSAAPRNRVLALASRSRSCSSSSMAVAMFRSLLLEREQCAPDPDDRPDFRRQQRRSIDVPAVTRSGIVARVGAVPDQFPGWGVGLDTLAKFLVFQPCAGQHGDKASAGAVDVIHILARAQF